VKRIQCEPQQVSYLSINMKSFAAILALASTAAAFAPQTQSTVSADRIRESQGLMKDHNTQQRTRLKNVTSLTSKLFVRWLQSIISERLICSAVVASSRHYHNQLHRVVNLPHLFNSNRPDPLLAREFLPLTPPSESPSLLVCTILSDGWIPPRIPPPDSPLSMLTSSVVVL